MNTKRKYELSEEELRTLIFMAASRVCDKQELDERDQMEICENAGSIATEKSFLIQPKWRLQIK